MKLRRLAQVAIGWKALEWALANARLKHLQQRRRQRRRRALAGAFALGAAALVGAVWWEEIRAVRGAQERGGEDRLPAAPVPDAAMGASRDRLERSQ
jgi:ferric-dicitrate binding protein FerR (iron transport regulator)